MSTKSKVEVPFGNTAIAFNESMVPVQEDKQYFSQQRSRESY